MIMKNYENLLQDLLFGAKDLIDKANNVSDQFDMSIRLAEQVTKAMKVMNKQVAVQTQEVVVEDKAVEVVKQVALALSKEQYEEMLGYSISNAAYDEYVDIFNRQAAGEKINLFIPDPDGLMPIPEGAVVSLAVQENPAYKQQQEEELVEQVEAVLEEEVEETIGEQEEVANDIDNMTVEEVVEQVLSQEDNGVEIDIDEDPSNEPDQVFAEIDEERVDITEQYNLMKKFNNNLNYDDAVERAAEWVEFGIDKETYDILNFIEDKSSEIIQCKTYLAYYINAMEMDSIVYYINYFASNVEEDEEGNEVYVNDELQLEFLNEDNISAFLEYIQQLQ